MQVHIYDKTGLLESRPESEWKNAGREIYSYNLNHPENPKKLFVGDSFPPEAFLFDAELGDLRPITIQERINSGEIVMRPGEYLLERPGGAILVPAGFNVNESGRLTPMTIQEKIAAGLVQFDSSRQTIANGEIQQKTQQQLVDEGLLTHAELFQQGVARLRYETETHLQSNTTPNGYRLDNLARQKAALTMQYRQLPDTDPVKSDLLQRKVIYTDAIVDEILNEIERVQSAYDQAKNALQSIANQNQPVSVFDSIKLEDYLSAS